MPQTELTSAQVRRRFRMALGTQLKILWPIVSALLLIQFTLGVVAGIVEQCRWENRFILHALPD